MNGKSQMEQFNSIRAGNTEEMAWTTRQQGEERNGLWGEKSARAFETKGGIGTDLRSLISQKEKELHDINDYRIRSLEDSLREKDAQLQVQRERFNKLKEDFQYNLRLIEDRDSELMKYDSAFTQVKSVIREKDAEISDLQVQLADLEERFKRESAKSNELDAHYKDKLKDLRAAMDGQKWSLEEAGRREREAFTSLKNDLERKLRDKEEQLDLQRRELEVTYEGIQRQRLGELKQVVSRLEDQLKETNQRNLELQKSQEEARESRKTMQEQVDELREALEKAEKRCKGLTWELEDVRKLKDAKIADLNKEKDEASRNRQKILDEYENKMTELLTSLHTVEKAYVQQKEQYESQLQSITQRRDEEVRTRSDSLEQRLARVAKKLQETEEQLESSRKDFGRAKWDYEEQLAQKRKQIDQLQKEVDEHNSTEGSKISRLQAELDEKENELETTRLKLRLLEQDVQEKERVQIELESTKTLVEELREAIKTGEAESQKKLRERETELIESRSETINAMQTQRDRLLTKTQEQEAKIFEQENTITELRSQVNTIQAELRATVERSNPFSQQRPTSTLDLAQSQQPLFDGDLGPPSPIGSWVSASPIQRPPLSSLGGRSGGEKGFDRDNSNNSANASNASAARVATLTQENERLSSALKAMRSEMESLMQELLRERKQQQEWMQRDSSTPPPPPPSSFASQKMDFGVVSVAVQTEEISSEAIAAAATLIGIENLIEENRLLHEQAQKLSAYIRVIQENETNADVQTRDRAELVIARDVMQNQAQQISLLKENEISAQRPRGDGLLSDQSRIRKANESLKKQLEEVRADLERVIEERDQLAELSAKLRAELTRNTSSGVSAEQLRQVEKQVAETFQSKIKSVEQALEQIVLQNRMLKQQVRSHRASNALELDETLTSLQDPNDSSEPKSRDTAMRSAMTARRKDIVNLGESFEDFSLDLKQARADRYGDRVLAVEGVQAGSDSGGGRQTARQRLDEARKKLERSGRTPNNQPTARSSGVGSSRSKSPSTEKKAGQVTIGRHRIRNYAMKD